MEEMPRKAAVGWNIKPVYEGVRVPVDLELLISCFSKIDEFLLMRSSTESCDDDPRLGVCSHIVFNFAINIFLIYRFMYPNPFGTNST